MKQINTIQFTDIDSNDEALIIVRASEEYIALCISKREDGDIEVVFQSKEGEMLLEALQQAILMTKSS
jgi:nitrate reductase NapAB chaperone NapD